MAVLRRWALLVAVAGLGARAQFAETKVFEIATLDRVGMLGGPAVAHDLGAGCLDAPGIRRRFGDRCVAPEARAIGTCAALADCAAVVCLPAAAFASAPDLVGEDDAGAEVGARPATRALWAAAAAGDGASVAREIDAGGDVDAGDAKRRRTPLMLAAAAASLPAVRALLAAGASTLAVDAQGLTALSFARNAFYSANAAPPAAGRSSHREPYEDAIRSEVLKVLEDAAAREILVRERNGPTASEAAARARARETTASLEKAKRSAARARHLLDDGVLGRSCLFFSNHAPLDAHDPAQRLCDGNATATPAATAERPSAPKRDCGHHLLTVKAVRDALRLQSVPGYASRAITNAAREKRTALVYDETAGIPEWQRHLDDLGRGLLVAASSPTRRRLAVVDGTALQTCAPSCRPKRLVDARAAWDASTTITDPRDGATIGVASANYTGGVETWLENIGAEPTFPW